jgi:hypothetical protein
MRKYVFSIIGFKKANLKYSDHHQPVVFFGAGCTENAG